VQDSKIADQEQRKTDQIRTGQKRKNAPEISYQSDLCTSVRDRLKGGRGLPWEIKIGGGGGLLCDKEETKGFLHVTMRGRPGAGRGGYVRRGGSGRIG
jgi:hypothetical protein